MVIKTILLADDDPEDAEMFSFVLTSVDPTIKFYHVNSGLSIFGFLADEQHPLPNLIFLDINMPEMNGWQCLSKLKTQPETQNIPVVIYSTSSHPRDKQIAIDLGACDFITKPSDYKTLQNILSGIVTTLQADPKEPLSFCHNADQ
jgi:CheY-like chemotaxis protein